MIVNGYDSPGLPNTNTRVILIFYFVPSLWEWDPSETQDSLLSRCWLFGVIVWTPKTGDGSSRHRPGADHLLVATSPSITRGRTLISLIHPDCFFESSYCLLEVCNQDFNRHVFISSPIFLPLFFFFLVFFFLNYDFLSSTMKPFLSSQSTRGSNTVRLCHTTRNTETSTSDRLGLTASWHARHQG